MSIILNEVTQANTILEKGEVGNKPASTLFLLGRYYKQQENMTDKQVISSLNSFMEKNYKNYNPALWEDIIEDIVKKSGKYPLRELSFIGITETELDRIEKAPNMKCKKLLFTILCHAKLYNTVSTKNNAWVNTDIKELYRCANVTVKHRMDKFLILNDLEHAGFLRFSQRNDSRNLQVTFVDMEHAPVLKIYDFRELGYEYMNFSGDGCFVRCQNCKRLVKKKSRHDYSTKYCSDCARKRKNEQNKISYMRKTRKSQLP